MKEPLEKPKILNAPAPTFTESGTNYHSHNPASSTRIQTHAKILSILAVCILTFANLNNDATAEETCIPKLKTTFKEEKHIMNKYISKAVIVSQLIQDPRKTTLEKAIRDFFTFYLITIDEQKKLIEEMEREGHCLAISRIEMLNKDFKERAKEFNQFMELLY